MIPDHQNTQTQWPWLASDADLPQQPIQLPSIDFTGRVKRQYQLLNVQPSQRPEMVSRPAHATMQIPSNQIRVWDIPQWSQPSAAPKGNQQNLHTLKKN